MSSAFYLSVKETVPWNVRRRTPGHVSCRPYFRGTLLIHSPTFRHNSIHVREGPSRALFFYTGINAEKALHIISILTVLF